MAYDLVRRIKQREEIVTPFHEQKKLQANRRPNEDEAGRESKKAILATHASAEPIPWLLFAGGGILFVSAVLSSPYLALVGLATGLYAEYIQSIDNKKDLNKSVLNALLG